MGNASTADRETSSASVHPHVHGERAYDRTRGRSLIGSSPRAWGTLTVGKLILGMLRFIPTCMGNAVLTLKTVNGLAVHPHVHGERFSLPNPFREKPGSSPRAWGTHYPHSSLP